MLDYVELLGNVITAPEKTFDTGSSEEWNKFEKEIGIIFPDDYKKIISKYDYKFTYRISDIFESCPEHTLQFYHCKCFKYENGVFPFLFFISLCSYNGEFHMNPPL